MLSKNVKWPLCNIILVYNLSSRLLSWSRSIASEGTSNLKATKRLPACLTLNKRCPKACKFLHLFLGSFFLGLGDIIFDKFIILFLMQTFMQNIFAFNYISGVCRLTCKFQFYPFNPFGLTDY